MFKPRFTSFCPPAPVCFSVFGAGRVFDFLVVF